MIFLLIFLIELISLFFVSRLMIKSLGRLFYSLTKSREKTVNLLAILFLPGTIIHEFSHVLSAGVLFVETGHIEFMPKITDDGIKLGSAQIAQTDPIRRALIGVAPFLLGLLLIIGVVFYFSKFITSENLILFWFIQPLIIFEIANTMFSSKRDLEGTLEVGFLLISVFIGLYFLGLRAPFDFFGQALNSGLGEVLKNMDIFLGLPIILDLLIFGIISLRRL